MRKHDGINLLKFYSTKSWVDWNKMLTDCYIKNDINKLVKIHYEISVGQTDLSKQKLSTDKMNETFTRMLISLEKTALKIAKKIDPNPLDSITNENLKLIDKKDLIRMKKHKKDRTNNILNYFRKKAF